MFGLYENYGYGIVGAGKSLKRPGRTAAGLAFDRVRRISEHTFVKREYIDVYDGRNLRAGRYPTPFFPELSSGASGIHRRESRRPRVLAIQSVLIAGLVVHRSRRRSAERALRLQKDELSRANRQFQEEASERERIRSDLQASREEYRWLAGNLLTSQEKERRKFAHELHDDITQRLAALSIEAGMLEREFRDSPEPLGEKLKGIRKELMKLSGDIHLLSRQLHPSILDDLGLPEAMRAECARFSRHEGITVSYEPKDVPQDLPGDVKLCSIASSRRVSGTWRSTPVRPGSGSGLRARAALSGSRWRTTASDFLRKGKAGTRVLA
jgi:hypothetical protein